MTYNVWNKWGKLKTVMIGSCHPLEFYDIITNDKIRDPLLRITQETLEDLDYFKKVLKDFGCNVIQAPTQYQNVDSTNIHEKFPAGTSSLPRSSLQPRDCQVVIGNKCVISSFDNINNKGIIDTLKSYNSKDLIIDPLAIDNVMGKTKMKTWEAPGLTVVGNRIYVDTEELSQYNIDWLKTKFPEFKYVKVSIGGHNDGCFHTLKPGAILSLYDIQTYDETFPGWDVCYLPDQSWSKIKGWQTIRSKTQGKWWLPGEEHNDEFINFVNAWLSDWVGYVEETVFDVNVLVLDEHHVCISNPHNEDVNKFLQKHNMEPVHIPWRHRYFWDGGLHCITLDLEREGKMENYF